MATSNRARAIARLDAYDDALKDGSRERVLDLLQELDRARREYGGPPGLHRRAAAAQLRAVLKKLLAELEDQDAG